MTIKIISRATWGAKPWNGAPATVSLSKRTEFFVHYDGGTPITRTGYAIMRAIEAGHINQGWSGVGYNFVIDQAGNIYEGRGWTLQGAHCPNHNISGIGVQIAIGGDQAPSAKALAACRALYEEACRKTGRTLAKRGHRDGFATACPGTRLYTWVQAGMPAGDYDAAPDPGGSLPGSGSSSGAARYQVTINGLAYGYGAKGTQVTKVGQALVRKGFSRHYTSGPGPTWTDADTLNYQDFQESLGYSGTAADGVPGKTSLKKLLGTLPSKVTAKPTPPFPGRGKFGPGKSNASVTLLGQQLVRKGFGRFYTQGPGPRWSDADRKNVEAFQRAQGWTGSDADGIPGPETWKRLFA
ncbi:peptidoglycan-binding domain-containing protein [Streptomyces ferrugineus]|uniref:Peptidoglycan-binding domain-containing protein n=1 Tax=Streptomyces ferrugineus TaxID=1413221 RepID=A0A7M2SW60_9ACTN|nr:peptidoglycan-binding protein [Streptomyces ferrugineus]QOV40129.1 peptidoglycan-binding domain-containing protein [Streptomyces ferrugineus]